MPLSSAHGLEHPLLRHRRHHHRFRAGRLDPAEPAGDPGDVRRHAPGRVGRTFAKIPVWVIVFLGLLAAFSILFDFLAGTWGAKRCGASKAAVWGAFIGTIVGLFFGIPGIILGPFVGAVVGQLASGSRVEHAARVGVGAWMGLLIGTAIKLATAFMMLGTFALALLV